MEEKCQMSPNTDILQSVYFMRRASMICCVIQSLSLSLFVITYNIQIAFYLPIFWSLSNLVFASNFIRNRQYISSKNKAIIKCDRITQCPIFKITETINNLKSSARNSGKSNAGIMDMVDHTSAGSLDDEEEEDEDGMVILDEQEVNGDDANIPTLFHTSQTSQDTITVNMDHSDDTQQTHNIDQDNLSPLPVPRLPKLGDFHSNPVFSKSKPKLKHNIAGYGHSKKDGLLSIQIQLLKGTHYINLCSCSVFQTSAQLI